MHVLGLGPTGAAVISEVAKAAPAGFTALAVDIGTSVDKARVQPYCATCPVVPRQTTAALFVKATSAYAARQDNR